MSTVTPPSRLLVILLAAWAVAAVAGCERAPPLGTRAPEVRFEPTPHDVVAQMLDLARVGANDVVFDLGCGDGRIVIAAAKRGARGVCVDIDPQRIRESRANAERASLAERIVFLHLDLLDTDLGEATVVTLFLSPKMNLTVRPKLRHELRPGARIVSYVHGMGDWQPQETRDVEGRYGPRKIFLWTLPEQPPGR